MFEQFLTGLSFRKYGDWVESQLLESLGNVMFFMLLYDMENLDKFIKELMDINVQSEDSKEKGNHEKRECWSISTHIFAMFMEDSFVRQKKGTNSINAKTAAKRKTVLVELINGNNPLLFSA